MKEIVFISGHRDITPEEFAENYAGEIAQAVTEGCSFVVGDCEGCNSWCDTFIWTQDGNAWVEVMFVTDPSQPGRLDDARSVVERVRQVLAQKRAADH